MTTLTRNQPFATREPAIQIDAGLPPGAHRFQLEVIDDGGLRSRPDAVTVVVQRRVIRPPVIGPGRPPVIDPVGPVIRPPRPAVPVAPAPPRRPRLPPRRP